MSDQTGIRSISYGGGVQSTALLVLAAVFATAALYAVVVAVWWVWRGVRRLSAELPIPALIASRGRPNPSPALPSHREALNASRSPESEKEPVT